MDRESSSQTLASVPCEADSEELQLKVDFFRKLGYSSTEVKTALRKLGLGIDTNAVLGELVRNRASTAPKAPNPDSHRKSPSQSDHQMTPGRANGLHRVTAPKVEKSSTNSELKSVVIDGSNVAMSHGNKEVFSCRGIQLAVNFFLDRGHTSITVFVPSWRKEQPRADAPIADQHILMELEKQKIVVFTPSRRVGGKRVVCYDDRFIVKLAHESDGVIVSNDTYRDLQGERPEWKKCIEERLLMFSFVNDKFMPPDDPLGRHGPNLDNFLRKNPLPAEQKRQLCPYDKKCTYGIKCKFYHPERTNQTYLSLADELREKAQISTANKDRASSISPSHLQQDHGFAPGTRSHMEQTSMCPPQVSENNILYWDGTRETNFVGEGQCPKHWQGPESISSHSYSSVSHDCLDSGLGSYESQYSDIFHCLSGSHMPRHQAQSAMIGPRYASLQSETNSAVQSCSCCSHLPTSSEDWQPHGNSNFELKCQPKYETFPSHVFPPISQHHGSIDSHHHYRPTPHHQQKYWSDPFQMQPHDRSCLPMSTQSSYLSSTYCSNEGNRYNCWVQPQPSSVASDPERLEARTKLQAIFNPQQVDAVMGMFPHLTNAEKLAAEIFNLKIQGRIF